MRIGAHEKWYCQFPFFQTFSKKLQKVRFFNFFISQIWFDRNLWQSLWYHQQRSAGKNKWLSSISSRTAVVAIIRFLTRQAKCGTFSKWGVFKQKPPHHLQFAQKKVRAKHVVEIQENLCPSNFRENKFCQNQFSKQQLLCDSEFATHLISRKIKCLKNSQISTL